MKLPNCKKAVVSRKKLTYYILSETHSTGKFKAKIFRKLGFDENNVTLFEKALHKIAESENVTDIQTSKYGTKYVLNGKINAPFERTIRVKTIWIIEKGQKNPRFITVYPV